MTFLRTLPYGAALIVGTAVLALPGIPLPALAASPRAPRWTIDYGRSQVGFGASMNGQGFRGIFRRWSAQIAFDPANLPASSVDAVFSTGSIVTGDGTRDQALPSSDWFNATVFPQARFVARRFKALGGNRYAATGRLTIRGISRDVTLPFTLNISGKTAQMQGNLTLDRTLFSVGQGQFAGNEPVGKAVVVTVRLVANRQAER